MHWGPQSIPGVDATWYARRMYQPGMNGYKYHVATYGHPSKFGYKDICKLFTAPKFDQAQADRLVELYKKVGARYVVPVAVHHDNFDMWDSKYQPRWNSVVTFGKDVVGMWKKAADKHGLHLGVASHNARLLPMTALGISASPATRPTQSSTLRALGGLGRWSGSKPSISTALI